MGDAKRSTPGASSLLKPGWLPTAILVNILEAGAERNGQTIPDTDLVRVEDQGEQMATVHLPPQFTGPRWEPSLVFPLEVIDGQHRLWAFEKFQADGSFELPVVAFCGLDRSWQAYLFWSVNITPKRINRSLAFDLYPLLRREDWLTKFAGHSIYRETRCQELVEALWSHPESPWRQRINMLGETARQRGTDMPMVSQAAWVRSLMTTFVKEWPERGRRVAGLFGAPRLADETVLPWNRAMQAAVLIVAGQSLLKHVTKTKAKWAQSLRNAEDPSLFESGDDPAFYGKYSLLTTDQGIRGFLFVVNDLCFSRADDLALASWIWESVEGRTTRSPAATEEQAVGAAVRSLRDIALCRFLDRVGKALSSYDWRTSSTPGLAERERLRQSVFRGSSGYREMRRQLLQHLAKQRGDVGRAASDVMKALDL